ncbi:MAG TPA: hypothetical protein VGD91_08180, partial [Trebonia sp.]
MPLARAVPRAKQRGERDDQVGFADGRDQAAGSANVLAVVQGVSTSRAVWYFVVRIPAARSSTTGACTARTSSAWACSAWACAFRTFSAGSAGISRATILVANLVFLATVALAAAVVLAAAVPAAAAFAAAVFGAGSGERSGDPGLDGNAVEEVEVAHRAKLI